LAFQFAHLNNIESIGRRFEIVTQSPTELEAAVVNPRLAREEVHRENADLTTRMGRQLG
jgi:hypothetical protein